MKFQKITATVKDKRLWLDVQSTPGTHHVKMIKLLRGKAKIVFEYTNHDLKSEVLDGDLVDSET